MFAAIVPAIAAAAPVARIAGFGLVMVTQTYCTAILGKIVYDKAIKPAARGTAKVIQISVDSIYHVYDLKTPLFPLSVPKEKAPEPAE